MKKLLSIAVLTLSVGCSSTKPSSQTVYPETSKADYQDDSPVFGYEARYIPEAHTYIDYSHNPLSYHYHGRNREITKEEREIFDAEVLSAVDPDNVALSDKAARLREKYRPLLEQLAKSDAERYKSAVQDVIAEAKKPANREGETAGK